MYYQIKSRPNKAGETRYAVGLEVWMNGQRKFLAGGTFATEREARRAGEQLLLKYENDDAKLTFLRGTMPLSDWAEEFLADLTVKEPTVNSYRWRMENWVLPHLGDRPLKDLTTSVIEDWVNGPALARLGRGSKKEALSVLRCALAKAVRRKVLSENPAKEVHLDQTKAQKQADKERRRIKAWTYGEVDTLLDASVGLPIEPVVILGLLAGLRPGESMATRWSDIDWTSGTVTVGRTQSRTASFRSFIADTTKSGATRRPRLTSDAAFRLMRMKERLEAQGPLDPDALLYPATGSNATSWRQIKALCKKVGIKQLSPHCLRHTHASLLLENGATLAAVAKQLGHSNPVITAAIYWHLVDNNLDTISGVMDKALRKEAPIEPDPSDASRW